MEDHARRSSRCWPSTSIRSRSSPSRRWSSATSTSSRRWPRRTWRACIVSITTLDRDLARTLEPRAAAPAAPAAGDARAARRRHPGRRHGRAGHSAAQRQGSRGDPRGGGATPARDSAGWIMLRLPLEVAPLFRAWLDEHYPLRAAHVMSLVQQMRGGRDYDQRFGARMRGTGAFADLIEKRFELACKRLGLNTGPRRAARHVALPAAARQRARRASCSEQSSSPKPLAVDEHVECATPATRAAGHCTRGEPMKATNHVAVIVAAVVFFALGARLVQRASARPWLDGIGKTLEQLTKEQRRLAAALRRRIPRDVVDVLHARVDRAQRHAAGGWQRRAHRRHGRVRHRRRDARAQLRLRGARRHAVAHQRRLRVRRPGDRGRHHRRGAGGSGRDE